MRGIFYLKYIYLNKDLKVIKSFIFKKIRVIYYINLIRFYIKLNQFVLNKRNTKKPANKPIIFKMAYLLDFCFGGDEGNRTPA